MPKVLPPTESPETLRPQGHAIGFVNTDAECDAAVAALEAAGFPKSAMIVLRGQNGQHLLEQMMEGSLWGESVEAVMKQGTGELINGHSVLCVEVHTTPEANQVATIATAHGVRSLYHFGILVDTRLTA